MIHILQLVKLFHLHVFSSTMSPVTSLLIMVWNCIPLIQSSELHWHEVTLHFWISSQRWWENWTTNQTLEQYLWVYAIPARHWSKLLPLLSHLQHYSECHYQHYTLLFQQGLSPTLPFIQSMTLYLHVLVTLSQISTSYTNSSGSTLLKLKVNTKFLPIPDDSQLWNSRLESCAFKTQFFHMTQPSKNLSIISLAVWNPCAPFLISSVQNLPNWLPPFHDCPALPYLDLIQWMSPGWNLVALTLLYQHVTRRWPIVYGLSRWPSRRILYCLEIPSDPLLSPLFCYSSTNFILSKSSHKSIGENEHNASGFLWLDEEGLFLIKHRKKA